MGTIKKLLFRMKKADIVTYSVGDTNACGQVAYLFQVGDYGYVEGEQHGFMIPVNDITYESGLSSMIWSNDGVDKVTGATQQEIGYGMINTDLIISVEGTQNTPYPAWMAKNFIGDDGCTGWCLPTKLELEAIWIAKKAGLIHTSMWSFFWCSTEESQTNTYLLDYRDNGSWLNSWPKSTGGSYACLPIKYF